MKGTELIFNKDESLYHLNLKPGDISDLIFTVGDPERVEKVSCHFDRMELTRQCREFHTHTGYIGDRRISVISTGIGTDNIDVVLNELHILHEASVGKFYDAPELRIIRLGTSGALQEDVQVDSLLLTDLGLGMDNLMHFYRWNFMEEEVLHMMQQDERWKDIPKPYVVRASGELLSQFNSLADHVGVTATACGFYAPQGRSVNLIPRAKDLVQLLRSTKLDGHRITNLEMETSGIYGLSSLLGHQALSISAILANRVTNENAPDPGATVDKMIVKALELAREL